MTRRWTRWASGLMVVCGVAQSSAAFAQKTVVPQPVRRATIDLASPWAARLRQAAAHGSSDQLAQTAREALEDLALARFTPNCCNLERDYFLVTFVAYDRAGAPALTSVLVHLPYPDLPVLPGIHAEKGAQLYEVFFSDDVESASLSSAYTVAHEENPADKQLSDFVSILVGKLALPATSRPLAGTGPNPTVQPPPPEKHPVAIQFGRVVFPEPGKVTIRATVSYSDLSGHTRLLKASLADETAERLKNRHGATPVGEACKAFNTQLSNVIGKTLESEQCGIWITDSAACGKKINEDFGKETNAYLALPSPPPPAVACPVADVLRVAQAYAPVSQDMKPITSTMTLANTAKVRVGYGLGVGYIASINLDADRPRTSIQSGKIAPDPFGRQLTMGVVNLTPWGYDAQQLSPSIQERARIFAGPIFSPNFGVAAGFAYGLNRYVALTVGYAHLGFDTPKPGEQLDQAPTAENKAAPFKLAWTGALFFGLNYNLK